MATQLISRIRTVFKVGLDIGVLWQEATLADLARRIDARMKEEEGLHAPAILRVSREGEIPLSFAQRRVWVLHQLNPDSLAYNMPSFVRLQGPLRVTALEQALTEVVRRHEVLRTTFSTVKDRPAQIIAPPSDVRLSVTDLRRLPDEQRNSVANRLALQESRRPFDLTRGPLLRSRLLRVSDQEHILLITMHHIICDGWSIGLFVKEITSLYLAISEAKPSPLDDLPIQYADFACWEHQWMHTSFLEDQVSYWKGRLGGTLPMLRLPLDRLRPPLQSFRGATQSLRWPEEVCRGLRRLTQEENVTLFMTLLAAFEAMLHYYTEQEDIVVGTDIANRNREEIEPLIGFFVNQLVLRTDLSGDPTFREILARVREVALGAYIHQDLPFDMLVDALKIHRDMSLTPLFQVKFVLQNMPAQERQRADLTVSILQVENQTAKFDLLLNMAETARELTGTLEYNTDIFDSDTITRMLKSLEVVAQTVHRQPDITLNALRSIIASADQEHIEAREKGFKTARQQKLKRIARSRGKAESAITRNAV